MKKPQDLDTLPSPSDPFIQHEVMDRASLLSEMLDQFLGGHSGMENGNLQQIYKRAEIALSDLYQEAGRIVSTHSPKASPAFDLFDDVLALGIYRHEPRGMVTMIPIGNNMDSVRSCTLQGVVWLQTPTKKQRAAIGAQIPHHIAAKECWPSANPDPTKG